jgi:fumarate hydratase class I
MPVAARELKSHVVELIRRTSTSLPPDVLAALAKARDGEPEGSLSRRTFGLMIENAASAKAVSAPICQDTGTLIFYVDNGPDVSPFDVQKAIVEAVKEATKRSYLRPNAVDAITGRNTGDNVGTGSPYVHFHARRKPGLRIRLMMKGGGSENVGAQYSLPDGRLGAGRDLDGVRRCIIDAVQKAQGYGCAPGTLGVGVGGDRMTSYMESKEQLFRPLQDTNPDPELAALEAELGTSLNTLGIGPMGFGGKTTVLGVKIGARYRVPASFFVAITYMCWAYRRGELEVKGSRATIGGESIVATPARKVVKKVARTVRKLAKKTVRRAARRPLPRRRGR